MSKSFSLQPLLELSQERLDAATRQLGELIAKEQEGTRKLELLNDYRSEYATRFQDAARNGLTPDAWRNYSSFISRIDEAIAAQVIQLSQSKQRTAAGQQAWVTQRNKVKAFDTLQQRHNAELLKQTARQEQKQSDEHSAKQFSQKQQEY